jgi:hypothetical protein
LVAVTAALTAGACAAGGPTARPLALPTAPAEQAKCRVAASQSSPLVTEWPASEKANLEAMIGVGAVAVAYSGCAMRVLPQCRLRGAYRWMRTTPATDVIEIKDQDELYAKLPLGAASLEGELKRSGELEVRTTISGQLKLEGVGASDVPTEGECATATHLVAALSVGAFSLGTVGALGAKGSLDVTSVGSAGGGVERSEKRLRSAGDPDSCRESTQEAAHANCRSPIQTFLLPLPGRVPEEGPAGTVKVDFVSAAANDRWDVYADDAVICTTPCTKWMNPSRPVMLRGRDGKLPFMSPDRVSVARLDGSAPHLQLQANGTATTRFLAGVSIGGLGASAVLMGAMLAGMTCGDDTFAEHCKPGLITLGVGVPVALVGAWLIWTALPTAEVHRLDHASTPAPARPRRLVWGPGFVGGAF